LKKGVGNTEQLNTLTALIKMVSTNPELVYSRPFQRRLKHLSQI